MRVTDKSQVTIPKDVRDQCGIGPGPLPDFLIGAHAAVSDLKLLTRDPARVRSYYPRVRLIAPEASS